MNSRNFLSIICLIAFGVSCSSPDYIRTIASDGAVLIDTARLSANLRYLASDSLSGREATTEGERIASEYIAARLREYGVQPAGDDGTFFQTFHITRRSLDSRSTITLNGSPPVTLGQTDDFVLSQTGYSPIDTIVEMLFVGYGISAPEYEYDDYRNLDARGKIVIAFAGEPEREDEVYFKGRQDSKYTFLTSKIANARGHGAKALLLVSKSARVNGWKATADIYTAPSFALPKDPPDSSRTAHSGGMPAIIISDSTLRTILRGEEHEYDEVFGNHLAMKPLPAFALRKSARLHFFPLLEERVASRNIVGIVEGSDPILKSQYVAIGAHYDHVGIFGGKIYNGADDDGSGTVTVLEVARAFARTRTNKRSVLIVFHAAEEKGLLGSQYLTGHHPEISKVIAQVNLDMVGREKVNEIHCIGSNKLSSELYDIVRHVNHERTHFRLNYAFDDPNDPNDFFRRSDHYNYAKRGIPIVFFFDGMTEDYHQPTDDVEKINFVKIQRVGVLAYSIVEEIANLQHTLSVDKKWD